MKKIAIAFAALVAASMAVSCQKEAALDSKSSEPMIINAIAEGIGTSTKVEMAYKYDLLWQSGDQIYVTDGVSNDTFTLSAGAGTTNGTFTQDGSASFSGDVEAFYPEAIGSARIWPATQTKNQTVPMYSKKTVTGKTEDFNFSSLGSVLQIVFNTTTESVTLKSIEIKDGSKTLSGEFTIDSDGKAVISATDGAGITLDLGTSGVALGEGANYFNIAIPAGTYSDLTITFTATNGKECVMHSSTMPEVKFNTVGRLTLTGEFENPGTLTGRFSVSASRQIQFSKGNLVATIDASGTPTAWKFAANQYDCLGEGGANKTIGTAAGDVDLFGWSTAATKYGISTSTTDSDYSGDFVDWGKNIGDGNTWRTLCKDEWVYLFETRTNASGLYKCGVTVCGKTNCVVIAPDGFTGTIETSYDATAWATAEAAGLVCLPTAGYRDGSRVNGVSGLYWSSTAFDESNAYNVGFLSFIVNPANRGSRRYGYSVRLITDVEGSAPEEPVIDPLSGKFSVSSTKQIQFSKGNLVATIDAAGTPTAWKFAANQYDCLGEGGANQTIGTAAGDVDLFGWSTEATKYGISTSTNYADYSGDFVDWGKNIGYGSTWRTLTKKEWVYLFKTRTNASGLYKCGVTVCGKTNCVVIAPDGFTGTIETSYDATAWATAETAGLVCLPAAGFRNGSSVSYVGGSGHYWSSAAYDSNNACRVYFGISFVYPDDYAPRSYGYSVRLITECK